MKHNVPVQSLIDHIKTALDVDPWAKEMVEELLLKEKPQLAGSYHKWDDLHGRWDESDCCGECGTVIKRGDRYCHECGKAVKWIE